MSQAEQRARRRRAPAPSFGDRAHFIAEPDALPRIVESEAREALDAL